MIFSANFLITNLKGRMIDVQFGIGFLLSICVICILMYLGYKLHFFNINASSQEKKLLSQINNKPIGMDVQEFVNTTITQIIEGITAVQNKFPSTNGATDALINPAWIPSGGPDAGVTNHVRRIYDIEFDLAVTASENSASQVGGTASIKVCGFDGQLNTGATSDGSLCSTNRIKFKIPVRYPLMKPAKEDWNAPS